MDAADARAFEAPESKDEWIVGEGRTDAHLASIVAETSQLTGWESLSELGPETQQD